MVKSTNTIVNTFGFGNLLSDMLGGNLQEVTLIGRIQCIVIGQTECVSVIFTDHINAQIETVLQILTIIAASLLSRQVEHVLVIEADHIVDLFVVIEFQFVSWSEQVNVDAE